MKLKSDYKPIVYLGLAIVLVSLALFITIEYFLPFAVGIIISLIIDPVINYFEVKLKIQRGIAVVIVLLAIISSFGYLIILAISRFIFEIGKLVNTLPNYTDYLNSIFESVSTFMFSVYDIIPKEVMDYLFKNWGQIITYLTGFLSKFYTLAEKLVIIPNLLIFLLFTFLSSFFFAKDKNNIISSIKSILPHNWYKKIEIIQSELIASAIGLIKAQIILIFISTIITIAGFYILNVDYALTLGIICGLLDILPVIGPSLIFVPWAIVALLLGNLKFSLSLIILHLFVSGMRQILQAKVIGTHLGLDPLLALISIYVGVKLFGFMGLFIGPMVAVIVKAIFQSGFLRS
ncbi:sporulation integral membrane protein YtvI [Caldanaerovirga acetigignens]|uniref:Sporulation integral membrane protein YtvI n=1 Tax=Caldanaerovirga acetigignens TaxID=447595 RepID=A0A1M7JB27_9FIRM|nr:sporulation integral membrane protein YtvI [Caldanaerovirga acetigignens]SHM50216.1 sporulation integral membrane protein YtvI [Caldanaerovirga acetigignens]